MSRDIGKDILLFLEGTRDEFVYNSSRLSS
jgi:hypothetical protein